MGKTLFEIFMEDPEFAELMAKADAEMEESERKAGEMNFKKYTTTRKTKDGYSITCKKGLWKVHAPTKEQAECEAERYLLAYLSDGEYN